MKELIDFIIAYMGHNPDGMKLLERMNAKDKYMLQKASEDAAELDRYRRVKVVNGMTLSEYIKTIDDAQEDTKGSEMRFC